MPITHFGKHADVFSASISFPTSLPLMDITGPPQLILKMTNVEEDIKGNKKKIGKEPY